MWCRVDLVWIDVSEERIASIFRVEKSAREKPAWARGSLNLHIYALKMEGEYKKCMVSLALCLTN
jgi:hypothetical protein